MTGGVLRFRRADVQTGCWSVHPLCVSVRTQGADEENCVFDYTFPGMYCALL